MFENCLTPQDVKNEYRKLAFRTHPDMHPADEFARWNIAMQELNEAYHVALSRLDGTVFTGDDNKEHKYTYNAAQESDLIDAVARAIRAKLPDHVTVTIVGIYIWVEGLTREDTKYHAALKSNQTEKDAGDNSGFRFHSKRMCWYWKPSSYRAFYRADKTLDDLKSYYGARVVDHEQSTGIVAA